MGFYATVQEASGFGELAGACESDCERCHSLTMQEAARIVNAVNPEIEVLNVLPAPVSGLWEVDVVARGKKSVAYLDFAKEHLIIGPIIHYPSLVNVTEQRKQELNRVDLGRIPLEEAIVMGDVNALHQVIVFDDPDCPLCRKLHKEMKLISQERTDIVFYIKILPLSTTAEALANAEAIVCERSLWTLERALDGKRIKEPKCQTDEIRRNLELQKELGIVGTPTLILSDGTMISEYRDKDALVKEIDARAARLMQDGLQRAQALESYYIHTPTAADALIKEPRGLRMGVDGSDTLKDPPARPAGMGPGLFR